MAEYVAAGAYDEVSLGEATRAWQAVRLAPYVLRDVSRVDLATRLLNDAVVSPVGIAPTSMQRLADPAGELAMAAGAAGHLQVVSCNAGHRLSEIGAAAARSASPWWLQAYVPPEREQLVPVLRAAAGAGATAVVLTADTPRPGPKHRPTDDAWDGLDLSWHRANFAEPGSRAWAADLTAADIGLVAKASGLPVVVKGVLRPDDARRCVDAGARAVWVSNHGGRQLDRTVATATALPAVVEALADGPAEVYVDGGLRSGLDVLSALALGARACFLGRLPLYALAHEGAKGVRTLLSCLDGDLSLALELAGCPNPESARGLVLGTLRPEVAPRSTTG